MLLHQVRQVVMVFISTFLHTGGSGTGAKFKVIISGGSITSVVATNFGKNYKKNDTLTLAGV